MAGLTLDEFIDQVTSACAASSIVQGVSLSGADLTWVRLRAYLLDGSFLEAFYNEITGKTSFVLIRDDTRILGADNTGEWH